MNIDELKEELLNDSYKIENGGIFDYEVLYFYKRIQGNDCKTNERPPNIGITVYYWKPSDSYSFDIRLRAETPMGIWCDIGFYSMSLEEIIENRKTLEYLIEKQWALIS